MTIEGLLDPEDCYIADILSHKIVSHNYDPQYALQFEYVTFQIRQLKTISPR